MEQRKLKTEKTITAEEDLVDLKVDEEQGAEMKGGGGAVAGIVIAATSDNNRP